MVRKSEVIGNGRKSSEKFGSRKSEVYGNGRKSSEKFGSRKSEVYGNGRKSSEKFGSGSRRGIKEGHLSCYYTIVKSELIYVYEG